MAGKETKQVAKQHYDYLKASGSSDREARQSTEQWLKDRKK